MATTRPEPPAATPAEARSAPAPRRGFDVWPLAVAAVALVLDQATKAAIIAALGPAEAGNRIALIPDFLEFVHTHNTGIAFSLLRGQNSALLLIGLVVIGLLVYYYRAMPRNSTLLRVTVGGVVGGAVGNLVDRVRLGHVTDFIHVYVPGVFNYPVFNVADSFVTVGMIVIAAYLFFFDHSPPRGERRDGEGGGVAA